MTRKTALALALSVVVALLAAATIIARLGQHSSRHLPPQAATRGGMTVLQPPPGLTAFTLRDTQGHRFGLPQLRGRWSFVYFGYTHCKDVCPATLATLERLRRLVGGRAHGIQYVFASVDPRRDSLPVLTRYLARFNPGFLGVTGNNRELEIFARQMGVFYQSGSPHERTGYDVGHSDEIFLIDPRARLRAVFSSPAHVHTLAQGLKTLQDEG